MSDRDPSTADAELDDPTTLVERLREAYRAVEAWPEKDGEPRTVGGGGFMKLLELRNLVPPIIEAFEAQGKRIAQMREALRALMDADNEMTDVTEYDLEPTQNKYDKAQRKLNKAWTKARAALAEGK